MSHRYQPAAQAIVDEIRSLKVERAAAQQRKDNVKVKRLTSRIGVLQEKLGIAIREESKPTFEAE